MNLVYNGYPPEYTKPMEEELIHAGITPLHSVDEVNAILGAPKGNVLLMVNSVCGCAAGVARPGFILASQSISPSIQRVTVFAGVDRDATQRAREYMKEHPPSSPSIFLFKDGKCIWALHRNQIEGRTAEEVAQKIKEEVSNIG